MTKLRFVCGLLLAFGCGASAIFIGFREPALSAQTQPAAAAAKCTVYDVAGVTWNIAVCPGMGGKTCVVVAGRTANLGPVNSTNLTCF